MSGVKIIGIESKISKLNLQSNLFTSVNINAGSKGINSYFIPTAMGSRVELTTLSSFDHATSLGER